MPRHDYREIRRHGEETYPEECCGVLLGKAEGEVRRVVATVRCNNSRTDSPRTRYGIEPLDLVRIQRDGREQGLEIVGIYHSHPDHSAYWSQTDLSDAHWVGCSYVITSVEAGKAVATNSFALQGTREEDKRFVDEEIAVDENDPFATLPKAGD